MAPDGTDTSTVEHAAKALEGLLFPEEAPSSVAPPVAPVVADTAPSHPAADEKTDPAAAQAAPDPASETTPPVDAPPPSRSRKLRLPDGTEQDITEDEAYSGYLRTADYTRKAMAAADARKQAEAEQAQAREARTQYAALLEETRKAMDVLVPKEPDWQTLARTLTPEEYAATHAQFQSFKQRRDLLVAEQERIAKTQAEDAEKQLKAHLASESEKLLIALPEWRDAATASHERESIRQYAQSLGWTEDQIQSVADHRLVVLLRRAWKWDQLQTQKPKTEQRVANKPSKTVAPGAPDMPKPAVERSRAMERLVKGGGKLEDAAKYFETFVK